MATSPSNLRLRLLDGTSSGIIECTVFSWVGAVYRMPRTHISDSRIGELFRYGAIYFLLGTDSSSGVPSAYVGQASSREVGAGLPFRLDEHDRRNAEINWSTTVILTSKNEATLGLTQLSYLERKCFELIKASGKVKPANRKAPSWGSATEEEAIELDMFLEPSLNAINILGNGFLEAVPSFDPGSLKQTIEPAGGQLHLSLSKRKQLTGEVIRAECVFTGGMYVVLKGSKISSTTASSISVTASNARNGMKVDQGHTLLQDIAFETASAAASFVTGASADGYAEWTAEDGRTLRQLIGRTRRREG